MRPLIYRLLIHKSKETKAWGKAIPINYPATRTTNVNLMLSLIGQNLSEMEAAVTHLGYSPMHAREVLVWAYRLKTRSLLDIQSIPLALRKELAQRYSIALPHPKAIENAADGTQKYCLTNSKGHPYEAAFMPGLQRNTLCISTQSGCRMGCTFCHTASMGFNSNLSAEEILLQILAIDQCRTANRLVIMGMGEPLDNHTNVLKALEILNANWGFAFGASNITLSTVGINLHLKDFIDSGLCNIAISLHNPFPEERLNLVPAERRNPIREVIRLLTNNPMRKGLRVSFEYVIIPGINNHSRHAQGVMDLLHGLKSHVNVIPLSSKPSNNEHLIAAENFQQMLNSIGQSATLRQPRGIDIDAACGMLAAKK